MYVSKIQPKKAVVNGATMFVVQGRILNEELRSTYKPQEG